jgi:hypothetical protein
MNCSARSFAYRYWSFTYSYGKAYFGLVSGSKTGF